MLGLSMRIGDTGRTLGRNTTVLVHLLCIEIEKARSIKTMPLYGGGVPVIGIGSHTPYFTCLLGCYKGFELHIANIILAIIRLP